MTAIAQRSFAGGEIAPSLYARVDQTKYATGLRTCRNSFVMRSGGVANRPGTTFVAELKDSSKTVRLIPFIFDAADTYMLEFGNLYMRVYRNGAQVTETAKNITGATQANPCVITSNAHGFSNGEEVYIAAVGGMTTLNGRNFKVANVTANTFSLTYMDGTAVNSTAFSAYTSGGTSARVYTITTPYLEADLPTLAFDQAGDVLTLVHRTYAPRELSRSGHTSWTLATITFGSSIANPGSLTNDDVVVFGGFQKYHVTSVNAQGEESASSVISFTRSNHNASSGSPTTISWAAATDAIQYNIYKSTDVASNTAGLIGTTGSTSFIDDGIEPDYSQSFPIYQDVFFTAGEYPGAVAYAQQRRFFASTNNEPAGVWASRIGSSSNFLLRFPLQDDDALKFTIVGRKVTQIRHLAELRSIVTFSDGSEGAIEGNEAGVILPTAINAKQYTPNGSSTLHPLLLNGSALYVQARGSIIRDVGFDFQVDGYKGNDLTIFSAHLVDGYTLRDWTSQLTPHSIVWAVRDDGVLLGLTYIQDQQMLAWHRHDFDGTVEQVCSVPEGTEDAVYLVIKRTIGSSTKRYVERFASRRIDDIVDSIFMDSALSFDGRNTNTGHTMTLSGGTTWKFDEVITLTSSASFFTAADVGNAIHLTGSDGTLIRFRIDGYTSATVVTGRPSSTVPAAMRSVAISDWTRAVDDISGLWHLEGKEVSVFADGYVVASPNNAKIATLTVASGAITLPRPYGVIHVGLPVTSDIETLDIERPEGESLADKKKLITAVSVYVEASRGIFAGPKAPTDDDEDPLEGLEEVEPSTPADPDEPVALETGVLSVTIPGEWNSNGRVFIRQVDPIPLSVLAVVPKGLVATRG